MPNAQARLLTILEELKSSEEVDAEAYDALVRLAGMCREGEEDQSPGSEVVSAVQEVQKCFSKKNSG